MTTSFQEVRTGHLYRLYTGFKKIHPNLLFLFRHGEWYEALYNDAFLFADLAGAPLDFFEGVPIARFPVADADGIIDRIKREQYVVGICERD